MTEQVGIALSADSALVLLALVARLNEDQSVPFADQSEQRALWDLEAILESAVADVVAGDYTERLERARHRIRDDE